MQINLVVDLPVFFKFIIPVICFFLYLISSCESLSSFSVFMLSSDPVQQGKGYCSLRCNGIWF